MLADTNTQWMFMLIGGLGMVIIFLLGLFLPPLIKEVQCIRRDLHLLVVGYENRLTQLETFQRIYIKSRSGDDNVESFSRSRASHAADWGLAPKG